MYAVIGIVILLVMVFGGFALTGGALGPVMHAIPHEMLIIGGAAVGALVTGNSLHGLKALGGALGKVFKGPRHTRHPGSADPRRHQRGRAWRASRSRR